MIETVNGYVCRDCSDVALAKRNVDPEHPKDGPNGVDAKPETDPLQRDEAVTFGGALEAARTGREDGRPPFDAVQSQRAAADAARQDGTRVDLRV
jgi:hypothetical protein